MPILKTLAISCGLILSSFAYASPFVTGELAIDFRDAAWNQLSNPVSVGGITVSATPADRILTWYADDGLGIGGNQVVIIEQDEIDVAESMSVSFAAYDYSNPATGVTGFWVSDLFNNTFNNDGGNDHENGYADIVLLDDSFFTITFNGEFSDQFNGEQYIAFNDVLQIKTITFFAGGNNVDINNDDYSVVGFTMVPEPVTVLLMGLGLLGMGLVRRKL